MTGLESIEARAQRILDGMTVNREAFARDVLKLCNATRRLRDCATPQQQKTASAAADFGDIFSGIFGGRRHG